MKLLAYLQLFRYQNLLMIAGMQLLFRYAFFGSKGIPQALSDWQYALLVLATVLIAAGANVINDLYDQNIDSINKPGRNHVGSLLSEDQALNLFIGLNLTGLSLGFYLSNAIDKTSFLGIFIISSMLSYWYATYLKKIPFVGNVVVSLLLAFTVLVVGLFDLIPAMFPTIASLMKAMLGIIIDYAVFAFIINFIREIIKDIEDIDGDYNYGVRSIPIVLGIARSSKLVSILSTLALVLLLWYVNKNFMEPGYYITSLYSGIFVMAPLGFVAIKSWTLRSKRDSKLLSNVVKLIILFGILSLVVIAIETRKL